LDKEYKCRFWIYSYLRRIYNKILFFTVAAATNTEVAELEVKLVGPSITCHAPELLCMGYGY
jgi:hypothetical protein